eukprot:CAMPEP_0174382778 /NCGR_PEP_ID=MMETSP0811_2-20130205/124799_1 /TAXON_ID=73025 ORGANISM="Eutreptiella gymnastica-like, Strain CCMP1594" /NCGR_SAMPLE_ID=MMETSP0811_2 /ASSEMBLY_ACC=CAM_ASM_000667 /LENGTH=52 /DNA_ID=CAMNT_0015536155 /DNA_START=2815 /DNA_END=2973 /DNA_ORIENTATION=+
MSLSPKGTCSSWLMLHQRALQQGGWRGGDEEFGLPGLRCGGVGGVGGVCGGL